MGRMTKMRKHRNLVNLNDKQKPAEKASGHGLPKPPAIHTQTGIPILCPYGCFSNP
jgi:hypothetical protein